MGTAIKRTTIERRPFMGAHRILFPVAVGFALIAVPLWLGRFLLGIGPAPGGGIPWHGHEMVFGYALAVVGGYLMTRISRPALAAVCACWLAGRLGVLVPDVPAVLDMALALAYPVSLFVVAGLPFLRAAKTGRNAVFAPLLASFAVAAFIAHSGLGHDAGRRGVLFGLDLLTMLLFVMGGRIMAAATSGAWRRRGQRARNVAQG
ncbi:MAG: NnrS family protein, partial [Alphaproteobacteria bacterium]